MTPTRAAMPTPTLSIGMLARRSGCSVPTIRYYEQIGLLPAASRRGSGHRVYGPQAEAALRFVRRCRDLGFTLDQVRELAALSASAERRCDETLALARQHLDCVRAKLDGLRALERTLASQVGACASGCVGGPAACCEITRVLARHEPPAAVVRSEPAPRAGG